MDPVSNATRTTVKAGGSIRRAQVAIAVFAALGVGLAYSYAVPAVAGSPLPSVVAKSTYVNLATEVCPIVTGLNQASMAAFSPVIAGSTSTSTKDTAEVNQMGTQKPLATLTANGGYATSPSLSGAVTDLADDSLPLIGQATGGLAPGFTVDGTLQSGSTGTDGYGLASAACVEPGTDFWFIGAGTDANPLAQLNLANTDPLTAQVNLSEYGPNGQLSGAAQTANQGLVVPAQGQVSPPGELIDPSAAPSPIAVNIVATTGRVTAALLAGDAKGAGRDFIAAEQPATSLVIPGIPAPATGTTMKLQLMLMATSQDADVTLKWVGKSSFTPSLTVPHLPAGHVQSIDISSIPGPGEAGALEIDSTGGTPIIGAIKVTQTTSGATDTAYLTPVTALTGDSVVAENQTGSSVELTNESAQSAQVKVTTTGQAAPAKAGQTPPPPAVQAQTVTVPAQTTMVVPLPAPTGITQFAVTVTPQNGASQIFAARVMTGTGPLITIQPMFTALESVLIPPVQSDLSGTVPQN